MASRRLGHATLAVHAGERYDPVTGAVGTPIFQTSTFYYPEKPDGRGGWNKSPPWIYTRDANPTVRAAEQKIAALEGAQDTVCFSSGMAAVSSAILSVVKPKDDIVAQASMYGGTTSLLNNELQALGIRTRYSYEGDADSLVKLATVRTRAIMVESPSNPFGFIVDLPRLRRGLEERFGKDRPTIIVDATLASPVNWRPLRQGADLVLHSATKYLNGHSDLIAGAVSGSRDRMKAVRPWLHSLGGCLDPHQAFLLLRGMKTLSLRVARHNSNATLVAQALAEHPAIKRVWHPSLPDHPHHDLGRCLMTGFGGVLAIQLRSRDIKDARRFMRGLELFAAAASLGGVESLVTLPVETQHVRTPIAMRKKLGINDTLLRLALGIEDADDLTADLTQSLDRLK